MFDKLKLTSKKEIKIQNLHNIFNESLCSFHRVPDKHYQYCMTIRKNGEQLIAIKSNPIMSHISSLAIELNPSSFKTYKEMIALLNQIAPIESYTIKRIDHCVDLKIPIETLYSQIMVKKKSKRSDFIAKDKLTGFTIGKIPEVICVYNKDLEIIKRKRVTLVKNGITRVEVRHYKNKIAVKNLSELYKYINHNPFKSICFLSLKQASELNAKLIEKSEILRKLCTDHGLQSAYKHLNQKSNFNRSFSKYFNESETSRLLHSTYKSNIKNFMEVH